MSIICSICTEKLDRPALAFVDAFGIVNATTAAATQCGHLYHKTCLHAAAGGNKIISCPICKTTVEMEKVITVYTNSDNEEAAIRRLLLENEQLRAECKLSNQHLAKMHIKINTKINEIKSRYVANNGMEDKAEGHGVAKPIGDLEEVDLDPDQYLAANLSSLIQMITHWISTFKFKEPIGEKVVEKEQEKEDKREEQMNNNSNNAVFERKFRTVRRKYSPAYRAKIMAAAKEAKTESKNAEVEKVEDVELEAIEENYMENEYEKL